MNSRSFTLFAALAMGALALAGPASAHHSFAMFERDKTVILTGVVKEFQWTNPHAWIQVTVPDKDGTSSEWGIECGSPNMMARQGWKSTAIKPGDKIALVMRPMKDQTKKFGSLVSVTLADGKILGPGGAPAPETGNAPPPK